jgi:hypothetical protein
VLDEWLITYNTKRPHQGRNMNGRTPSQAFKQGLPAKLQKEVTGKTKQPKLIAA